MRLKTGWLATQSARSWLIGLILAAVVVSLVAQWQQQRDWQQAYVRQQQASQRSGAAIIKKVCVDFGELAANKPPPGNPKTNPSRRYDQTNHLILTGIGADLCRAPKHR